MGTYEPSLVDVAKFVGATASVPAPECKRLFYYLVERIEPLGKLWGELNGLLPGGDSLRKVVELLLCLEHDVESESAYGLAVWMVEQVPETADMWRKLEVMGTDAGEVAQYPTYPVNVVALHQAVDRLLANERWATAEEVLDPIGELGIDYKALVMILAARIARGEGDAEHMKSVQRRLVEEAAACRTRPQLVRIVGDGREAASAAA